MSIGAACVAVLLLSFDSGHPPWIALGVLQYFAPPLQFLCGVLIFREQMSSLRWVGFSIIWVSLIGFALEGMLTQRSRSSGRS